MSILDKLRERSIVMFICMLLCSSLAFTSDSPSKKVKFRVLNALDERGIVILNVEINAPEYIIKEAGEWSRIICRGDKIGYGREVGNPLLPYLVYVISIPKGSKILKVDLTTKERKEIILKKPLIPLIEPIPLKEGVKPEPPKPNPAVYNSSDEFPAKPIRYSIGKMGSSRILILHVYLFRYYGAENKLIIYGKGEINIKLKTDKWEPKPVPLNAIDKKVKKMVINPDSSFFTR